MIAFVFTCTCACDTACERGYTLCGRCMYILRDITIDTYNVNMNAIRTNRKYRTWHLFTDTMYVNLYGLTFL
jgi:hypothetical protein